MGKKDYFILFLIAVVVIAAVIIFVPARRDKGIRFLLNIKPAQAKPILKYLAKNQPKKIKGLKSDCDLPNFIKSKSRPVMSKTENENCKEINKLFANLK
jgi:hypothetical protein